MIQIFYLRKRDLLKLINDKKYSIDYNGQKIQEFLGKGERGSAQSYECAKSISELELQVLEEIYQDYYQKGLWQCRFCHRQIHTEPELRKDAKLCPKCYHFLEIDGREIET